MLACLDILAMTKKDHTDATDQKMTDEQLEATEASTNGSEEQTVGQIEQLQADLAQAEQKYQRALADYQNLVRRNREESARKAKLATKDFVTNLVVPLNHLELAAQQLKDPGLDMVVSQLWQTLNQEGLEQVACLGEPFDAEMMEVVEITKAGKKVAKVLSPCYRLNGEIIQFAKVVLD